MEYREGRIVRYGYGGEFSVSFKPYSWIQMASSTYLSDEKAVEYPVRKAVGLTLDEKFYMPKSGKTEFQLILPLCPKIRRYSI